MGLRCIMGHDYGDPERTEEREENGDERVVTVREYRECRRCGHRKTISENTEVRTSETPEPGDAGQTGDAPGDGDNAAHPSMGRGGTADTAAGESASPDATPGLDAGERTIGSVTDAGRPSGGDGEEVTAAEDDGVILNDDTSDSDRGHGEWPGSGEGGEREAGESEEAGADAAGSADTGHGDWPTPAAEDEGYDAGMPSGGPVDGVDFGGGLTPEGATNESTDGEVTPDGSTTGERVGSGSAGGEADAAGTADATSGIARADSTPPVGKRPPDSGAVLSCPRCEHTAPSRASSLRPGDICPECNEGYLTEREQ